VVVVDECSIPRDPERARRLGGHLLGTPERRLVLRHLDLPWHHRGFAALEPEFPLRIAGALHAAASLRARRELDARGIGPAACVHGHVALDAARGDRPGTRAALGFDDDELVLFHPARGVERKNIAGAIRFANELARHFPERHWRYWLLGPIEEAHADLAAKVLARAGVPVTVGAGASVADSYAASDAVIVPSAWERFGDAVLESVAARRPCVASEYPTLAEVVAGGVRVLPIDDPVPLVRFLAQPPAARERALEANARRARVSFALERLPDRLAELLDWRA
jgi:glycosyltransferase involved in cell wall biosynthesis